MLQARCRLRLLLESLLEFRLYGILLVHDLHCHRSRQIDIRRPVNGPHAPFSDDPLNLVMFDLLPD
jgi:hypothetical protein